MIEIKNKVDCCGCTACASVCTHNAIEMNGDSMGFLYPVVDKDKCIKCGLCEKVCQFRSDYERYGNYDEPIVFGCRHKDLSELSKSQSGAASWAIIQAFLSEPGVVYGAGYKSPSHIIHKRATSLDDCREFRGSKYVQSDIRSVFIKVKNDLQNGERVLFLGTGCQVAGLKSYFERYHLQDKLFTVDVVCHATPSPSFWKAYIGYQERKEKNEIINVNFRDKIFGWHSQMESFVYSDGTKKSECIFREFFYNHMIIRPSCSNCPYTNFLRVSDITLGDFWGWEKYYTEWNDNKGVSLMLVNSEKGLQMKKKAERYLDYIESDIEKCIQPQLQHPVSAHPDSKEIEELFAKKGFEGVARRYGYIPGLRYYKERFMPYFNAGKNKILKIFGISK